MEAYRECRSGGDEVNNINTLTTMTNELKHLVKIAVSHLDHCIYGRGEFDADYMARYANAIRETAGNLERELEK